MWTLVDVRDINDQNLLKAYQILLITWFQALQKTAIHANDIIIRESLKLPPLDIVENNKKKDTTTAIPSVNTSTTVELAATTEKTSKISKGNNLQTFEFTDESPISKNMYHDCSHNHNFKVRGPTYLTDQRKVEAGSAICKLVMVELFEVEPKYGPRIDHVSSLGKCKERIEAITSLEDSPFVLVLNIQIPGDPPVSIVSYFVIPAEYRQNNTGDDHQKYIRLLDKFLDVPITEKARLAEWGIEADDDEKATSDATDSDLNTNGNAAKVTTDFESNTSTNTGTNTNNIANNDTTTKKTSKIKTVLHLPSITKGTTDFIPLLIILLLIIIIIV